MSRIGFAHGVDLRQYLTGCTSTVHSAQPFARSLKHLLAKSAVRTIMMSMAPQQTKDETDKPPVFRASDNTLAGRGFRLIERFLLIVAALMTLFAAGSDVWAMYQVRTIGLADILLMFLYTEVIGMIAVFYTGRGSPFIYPIFIAITALARLIVLQGKDMAPENVVFEAGAILLLALAAVIIARTGKT